MFEKEADEIARDIYMHQFGDDINYPSVLEAITVGFKKGAEFGYNKANEWHYVKDGDLPEKSSKTKLYAVWYGDDDYSVVQFVRGRFWSFICGWIGIDEVIAWCELPEPPKERE